MHNMQFQVVAAMLADLCVGPLSGHLEHVVTDDLSCARSQHWQLLVSEIPCVTVRVDVKLLELVNMYTYTQV